MDKAVALHYDHELPAPVVISKGKGELAAKIIQIADQHNIKIIALPALADMLVELDIGSFIPETFYGIIAELFIFIENLGTEK